jgi:pimeloyl-ACP methyl ester carboxylesterase
MASPAEERRRRLLASTQGRRLDEAIQHRDIRNDLQAEADDPDPDSIVTPDMVDQLHELMQEKEEELGQPAGVPPSVIPADIAGTPKAFFSTDTVIIVPGFLASALSDTAPGGLGLIWVSPWLYTNNEFGELTLGVYGANGDVDADPNLRIVSTGGIPVVYDLLRLSLEVRRYTTLTFGVDWRKDLEVSAQALKAQIETLASAPKPLPIHLVAHSQGALVARRALQLLGPDRALELVKTLVLLGPANFGSFAAAFALAGNHSSIDLLRKLTFEPVAGFRSVFVSMSGLYQLLPFDAARTPSLAEPGHDYGQPAFWIDPVDATRLAKFYGWGKQIDTGFFEDRTTVILGDNHGNPTVAGVAYENGAPGGLVATHHLDGDGTVTHANSVLGGATSSYLAPDTEHMMLPTYRSVIAAVRAALRGDSPALAAVSSDPADHQG